MHTPSRAGMGKLDVGTLMVVFLVSAILGDAVNYAVGNKLGGWAVGKKLVSQEYIRKTGVCGELYMWNSHVWQADYTISITFCMLRARGMWCARGLFEGLSVGAVGQHRGLNVAATVAGAAIPTLR